MVCKIKFCSKFPNIPNKAGRITRRRRAQPIAKRFAFHVNAIKKYCPFLYQILQLELIQESHYLIVYLLVLFILFLYDFSFDIWSKFSVTNSFKSIVISFWSLLKWPLYASLLLFFFERTSFPEGASSLPLQDIPPKLISYQPPKQKT